jgi:hypothetical protein
LTRRFAGAARLKFQSSNLPAPTSALWIRNENIDRKLSRPDGERLSFTTGTGLLLFSAEFAPIRL